MAGGAERGDLVGGQRCQTASEVSPAMAAELMAAMPLVDKGRDVVGPERCGLLRAQRADLGGGQCGHLVGAQCGDLPGSQPS
jgi:hypothetical protein